MFNWNAECNDTVSEIFIELELITITYTHIVRNLYETVREKLRTNTLKIARILFVKLAPPLHVEQVFAHMYR